MASPGLIPLPAILEACYGYPRSLAFDPAQLLARSGVGRKIIELKNKQTVYVQGDLADSVYYIQKGTIKLSVLSARGKEATLALLTPGEFFGENAIPAPNLVRANRKPTNRSENACSS